MIRIYELREEGSIEQKRCGTCEGDRQPVKDRPTSARTSRGLAAEAQRVHGEPDQIKSSGERKPSKEHWQEFAGK